MSRPTQVHTALFIGMGLLLGLLVLPLADFEFSYAFRVFTVASLVGGTLILIGYLSDRRGSHRAAGWFGINVQRKQIARSSIKSTIIGRASAAGATVGVVLMGGVAYILGTSIDIVVLAVSGFVAGFLVSLGLLCAYLVWRARQFYGPEHDVTDI